DGRPGVVLDAVQHHVRPAAGDWVVIDPELPAVDVGDVGTIQLGKLADDPTSGVEDGERVADGHVRADQAGQGGGAEGGDPVDNELVVAGADRGVVEIEEEGVAGAPGDVVAVEDAGRRGRVIVAGADGASGRAAVGDGPDRAGAADAAALQHDVVDGAADLNVAVVDRRRTGVGVGGVQFQPARAVLDHAVAGAAGQDGIDDHVGDLQAVVDREGASSTVEGDRAGAGNMGWIIDAGGGRDVAVEDQLSARRDREQAALHDEVVHRQHT